MVHESDNEEVFAAEEKMNEDILPTGEEAQSPPPNKEQPELSHALESDSDSPCPYALKKYDNILSVTERQLDTLWEGIISSTSSHLGSIPVLLSSAQSTPKVQNFSNVEVET
nr:hypothetical protein [Tanacetum cinerariifolium]